MQRSKLTAVAAATLFMGVAGVGSVGATTTTITNALVPTVPAEAGPPAKPAGSAAATADPTLATKVFNAVRVTVPTTDTDGNGAVESWFGGRIRIALTTGSVYNVPTAQGGATSAPSTFAWGFAPQTAFDTFVNSRNFTAATLLGGVDATNTDTQTPEGLDTNNAQVVSAVWVEAMPTAVNGTFQVGQFVLSNDAVGTWTLSTLASDLPGGRQDRSGTIVAGAMVPEPTGLGVLALAGVGLLARRRRRA